MVCSAFNLYDCIICIAYECVYIYNITFRDITESVYIKKQTGINLNNFEAVSTVIICLLVVFNTSGSAVCIRAANAIL